MNFYSLVEGPLLWIAFLIFGIGLISRIGFFFHAIIKSNESKNIGWGHIFVNFGRSLFPLSNVATKKPVYTALRYIFHVCLIVVPIWYSGHIVLWEESRFEWVWSAIPDEWSDWMTLLLLVLAAYFLLRRIISPDIRRASSRSDYFLVIIAALPFMTGYFLTHGSLDSISFFENNMFTIHIISGEAMLFVIAFLFYKVRLDDKKCTGCASCELTCPTGTLESKDMATLRMFIYSHYQCICCGSCVKICPENAAGLQHEISLGRFFQIITKREIRKVELAKCMRCDALFAPDLQLDKIGKAVAGDYIRFCPTCKGANFIDSVDRLVPWHKNLRESAAEREL
jgi:formate hydrogenlyase subunit 6/NADH:ubiquinone oxidoreductase subunit I/nitrate reductase gamma subunit